MKKTLIIGASNKPERYSYKAARMLKEYQHEIQLLGNRANVIFDEPIVKNWEDLNVMDIDTVTLYLSFKYQKEYYDKIIELNPNRVIFNPGTENLEFYEILNDYQISYVEACTLVLLRTGQY